MVRGDLRARFLREAQAAARFNHPNLVQVFEAAEAGPLCFIVSAFCEGPNLQEFLEPRAGSLAFDQAAQMVADLADGVEHIHCRGVLHRDIKPSNIMLEPLPSADPRRNSMREPLAGFTPKLTDFGLAKLVEAQGEQTRSGVLLGTTAYMPPEQARGDHRALGPASDVYGLGAVLYELLTGQPPFKAGSDGDTLRMVMAEDPVPPRRFRPQIPADLESICLRCLEKSPANRYSSAALLARDLRNFLAGEPTVARPLSPRGRLVRWARRQPVVASLSASVLLLLLTVATVSTVAAVRIDRSRREAEAIAERESKAKDEANRLRSQSVRDLNEIERRGRQMWRNVYVSNIRAAFEAQAAGDLGAVRKFLDDSRPGPEREDLRSFEWYYLWRELTTVGRTELATEGGPCYFVTYSPDGKLMAAGTEGGFVHIWNAVSLAPVHRWRAHSSCVNEIRFSPDGRLLATTSCDRTARLWHTVDWQPASEPMRRNQPLSCSAFTPDGKLLITSADTSKLPGQPSPEITVWDVATAAARHSYAATPGTILRLAVTLGGRRIVTINVFNVIQQWDLDGDALTEVAQQLTVKTPYEFCSLATCPDQRTIAYSSPRAGLEITDLVTGVRESWHRRGLDIKRLAIAHDGQHAVVDCRTGMAWVRRLSDGSLVEAVPVVREVHEICLSPDDRQLVTASHDGMVRVTVLGHPGRSGHLCTLSKASAWQDQQGHDSERIAFTGKRLWHRDGPSLAAVDLASGEVNTIITDRLRGLVADCDISRDELTAVISTTDRGPNHYYLVRRDALASEGRVVAEFDSEIRPRFDCRSARLAGWTAGQLWIRDASDGQIIQSFAAADAAVPSNHEGQGPGTLHWFAGGDAVIVAWHWQCLSCDLATGQWAKLGAAEGDVLAVEGGPYLLKRVLAGSGVSVCNGTTGARVCDFFLRSAGAWDLSPDGKRLVYTDHEKARLVEVETGAELGAFDVETPLHNALFSGDGRTLVLTSGPDSEDKAVVRSYFAATPEEVDGAR